MGGMARGVAVAAVGVALMAGADVVRGEEDARGRFDLALSTQTPGTATGLRFDIAYKNPDDPGGKPPAITGATFTLPAGVRIDDTAVPRCEASDEELRATGRQACPPASQVGTGTLTATTGFPGADPVTADVVAFNGPGQIVEVVFFAGTNAVAGIDRLQVRGSTLVAHPPSTPGGPPDGQTTVRTIALDLPPRVGDGGRPYVTAPPRCPPGGWASRADYAFADGGTTSLTSSSPCERPSLALSVSPGRVRAHRTRVFRIAARSADPACLRGARVSVAGRRTRIGPAGRARIRLRFGRPGSRTVVVRRPGCRPGATAIVVGT